MFKQDGFSNEQIALLKRKGVFPYDYFSSFEKLKEPNLPSKDDFFSSLYNAHINDEDYERAHTYGRVSIFKILGNILTYISRKMLYCWLKFLRTLEITVLQLTSWILLITTRHLGCRGTLCLKILRYNSLKKINLIKNLYFQLITDQTRASHGCRHDAIYRARYTWGN